MLFRKLKKKLLLKHKKTKEKPFLYVIEDLRSDASVDLDKLDKKTWTQENSDGKVIGQISSLLDQGGWKTIKIFSFNLESRDYLTKT